MKISDIQAQVKTKGRYSVFVDGRFAFGLSELGLINSGVKVGQEVNEARLSELKKMSATDKLYNMTLNLIARRPRSHKELQDYLRRKTDDEQEQRQILNMLSNLIDDKDFARRWTENRRLLKPISKRKLSLELRTKGISDQIINEVLGADEINEIDVLRELIVKKRKTTRYQDSQKLMQYLSRQGFNYQDIKEALLDNQLD